MSNHLHVVLRVRPVVVRRCGAAVWCGGVVRRWSDEEIAERRLTLVPRRVTPQREGPLARTAGVAARGREPGLH
jgi:hypothetical protein